ncbi:hypothetical protein KIN20_023763 [Parelaphostrongylus tenuis]|uniref:Uncharacterized protein n=1 Tax=Parelaphostrongylus tenuis TaxID=148309 RepID=A0AAD5MW40_PARTN|nr:hypothetical protein KIN20_023763 [Parelaphostrongylus tenuis]
MDSLSFMPCLSMMSLVRWTSRARAGTRGRGRGGPRGRIRDGPRGRGEPRGRASLQYLHSKRLETYPEKEWHEWRPVTFSLFSHCFD